MDKVDKFTRKLERHEALKLRSVISQIRANRSLVGLDVRKLEGDHTKYRVRIGRMRIQFTKTSEKNVITKIGFRDNNTY